MLPIGVIFKGTGKAVKDAEKTVMENHKKFVKVLWQENAWNSVDTEKEVLKSIWKPYTDKMIKKDPKAEFLMIQDNLRAHKHADVLDFLKKKTKTYCAFLPPETTNYLQMCDDNCGKNLRGLVYSRYQDWEKDFDWEKNPKGTPTPFFPVPVSLLYWKSRLMSLLPDGAKQDFFFDS